MHILFLSLSLLSVTHHKLNLLAGNYLKGDIWTLPPTTTAKRMMMMMILIELLNMCAQKDLRMASSSYKKKGKMMMCNK
jgi:hypothetical protein